MLCSQKMEMQIFVSELSIVYRQERRMDDLSETSNRVSPFDHNQYSAILFIDSMVALEAKPLERLPWKNIASEGAILLLVVPQVSKEIDKRKRDGRLGARARAFNRLIAPAALSGKPHRILLGPPAVDIAMARIGKVDWDQLDDLDPDEGDACVVAQILHARDMPDNRKVLFSQDINPIAMASRHALGCSQLPENWLLEPEPSPQDKEIAKLKERVRQLEASEPKFTFDLSFGVPDPFETSRVRPLTEKERDVAQASILSRSPRLEQKLQSFASGGYDTEYVRLYEKFVGSIPDYTATVHNMLEVEYGQIPFCFSLSNVGELQASHLIVSLTVATGKLHDRFTAYPVHGPVAPKPDPYRMRPYFEPARFYPKPPPGRHQFVHAFKPCRASRIEVHCADFRQGETWTFEGVAIVDPHAASPFCISARITASNLRGDLRKDFKLITNPVDVSVGDLIDFDNKKRSKPFPMQALFDDARKATNFDWFEIVEKWDGN